MCFDFSVRLEQGTVTSLLEENGIVKGVRYKTKEGKEITAKAPLTVVCDGCCSNLRRSLCTSKVILLANKLQSFEFRVKGTKLMIYIYICLNLQVDVPSCFVALILKNCNLPYPNHGHVVLAEPSPILLYPISSFETRCLVDIPGGQKVPSLSNGEMAHYLKTVVVSQLPTELKAPFLSSIEEGNIKVATNRSMPAAPSSNPGALLLGDAFNMRHPLTGGGMTVALSDIVVLRELLRPLESFEDATSLNKYLESFYSLRKVSSNLSKLKSFYSLQYLKSLFLQPVASTINTLAGALYKVFSATNDEARNELRQACFDYLSLGGIFAYGPVSLLSGLNPQPLNLIMHFFAVAIYGVGRLLFPVPSPKRMFLGCQLISVCI